MPQREGETRTIVVGNRSLDAYATVHRSGSGPGLLLLADEAGLDAGIRARADLFGEEGYAVLALAGVSHPDEVRAAAETLRGMPECSGGIAVLGHGLGGALACRAASTFEAAVAFDPAGLAEASEVAAGCPTLLVFGTRDGAEAEAAAARIEGGLDRRDGSGVVRYAAAAPGFAIPHRPAFDKRTDSLAHSRVLGLLRRVLGPHYDLVALFEEHVRHEFETRDVDATMATMIEEPYVNHVPTLAGGVGHDMLKRFYKYHFVHQNSRERSSVPVSETIGPDRIVLENGGPLPPRPGARPLFPGHRADRKDRRDSDAAAGEVSRRPRVPRAHLLGPGFGPQTDRRARRRRPARRRRRSRRQGARRDPAVQHLHAKRMGGKRGQGDLSPRPSLLRFFRQCTKTGSGRGEGDTE